MANQRFKLFGMFIRLMSSFIILVCLILTTWTIGPWLETRFNPAVRTLHISNMLWPTNRNWSTTTFDADFVKIRGECNYLGVGFYNASGDKVAVELHRSVKDTDGANRPKGFTKTGPWVVNMPPWELLTGGRAELYHQCHPFWTTVTNFYP